MDRLAAVTREIDNLAAHMLTGVLISTLLKLLGEREAEKARLATQLARQPTTPRSATILSEQFGYDPLTPSALHTQVTATRE